MKSKRIAIIDLGTNTFHLLIADTEGTDIHAVFSEKIPVRIGKGGINQGFISDEACARALTTMLAFKEKTKEYKVEEVYATATSAFRNARNGKELAEEIKKATGIEIIIISGEREAELIYYGVKEAVVLGEEKSLIIDIGGGSVEFILANKNTIFWKESLEIGGQRLMDMFQQSDPIKSKEVEALQKYLSDKLAPLSKALLEFPVSTLIGSAGSFETLNEIYLRKYEPKISDLSRKEYEIPLPNLYELFADIISKDKAARMEMPGMIELRVDMIVVASVLTQFVLDHYGLKCLRVSSYALKEGVLTSIMRGEKIIANP